MVPLWRVKKNTSALVAEPQVEEQENVLKINRTFDILYLL